MPDERLVGFVAGFTGLREDGRFKHASHMMGIHPDFQGQNIGYRLKLAQRQTVLAAGARPYHLDIRPARNRQCAA